MAQPRRYSSNAERQQAYRQRRADRLHAERLALEEQQAARRAAEGEPLTLTGLERLVVLRFLTDFEKLSPPLFPGDKEMLAALLHRLR